MKIDQHYFEGMIPARRPDSSKEDYGRVMAVCGCRGYTGAAFFAAQAAVRTGSGVVTLAVPDCIYPILATKLQEPVVVPLEHCEDGKITKKSVQTIAGQYKHAVLIGSGLGRSAGVREAVQYLLAMETVPIVLDADGINAICGNIDSLKNTKYPVVLTPHEKEFSRLLGREIRDREEDALSFAKAYHCIVLLKGHRTIIAAFDERIAVNETGNPGMAKGGSGDVLSGIILSLLGQGLAPFDAAASGAYLHGKAGDFAANEIGEYGMTPSDMLLKIPQVLRSFNSKEW